MARGRGQNLAAASKVVPLQRGGVGLFKTAEISMGSYLRSSEGARF
jgi:hypothetical protein